MLNYQRVPLIKSRDLYLAGGEKNSCPGLNLCISFIEPSSQHAQMIHCSTVTLLWTKWLTWPSVWVWVEFIQRIGTKFWGISSCYLNINHQITLRKSSWLQTIGASTHTGDRTVVSGRIPSLFWLQKNALDSGVQLMLIQWHPDPLRFALWGLQHQAQAGK